MPPWLAELFLNAQQNQNSPDEQSYNARPPSPAGPHANSQMSQSQAGVRGNAMAPIFQALAGYLSAQPELQKQKLQLARDVGTGVSTSPHDMLYGAQNPSAPYSPMHDAYWARMFGR